MNSQTNINNVNIFASLRLIGRFCKNECLLKEKCAPTEKDDQSSILNEPNMLIVGNVAQGLCPIACRRFVREGWTQGPFGCERQ